MIGGVNVSAIYSRLSSLKNPHDILKLEVQDLRSLLGFAYKEVVAIENALSRVEEATDRGKLYEQAGTKNEESILFSKGTKLEKVIRICRISPIGVAIFGINSYLFMLMLYGSIPTWDIIFIPMLGLFVYAFIRYFKDKKKLSASLAHSKNIEYDNAKKLFAEAQRAINNLRMGALIPADYRNSLALSKMMRLIDNQMAANDWTSLRNAFNNQKTDEERVAHQRFMERKQDDVIKILARVATASEQSADSNLRTAMASERSANANERTAKASETSVYRKK